MHAIIPGLILFVGVPALIWYGFHWQAEIDKQRDRQASLDYEVLYEANLQEKKTK